MIETPILTVKYNPLRVLWRLFFPNGLGILIFGFLLFGSELSLVEDGPVKFWFGMFFSGIMFSVAVVSSFEIILMKEIRFYIERIEKEWYILGEKTADYNRLRLGGMSVLFMKAYYFHYINELNLLKRRCCSFDMHLINESNREKIKDVLAKVSNRSIDEFEKSEINLSPFIKNSSK